MKLYRKMKRAFANEISCDMHFGGNEFNGDWYYEDEKSDDELVEELLKNVGIERNNPWYDYGIKVKFVLVEE